MNKIKQHAINRTFKLKMSLIWIIFHAYGFLHFGTIFFIPGGLTSRFTYC